MTTPIYDQLLRERQGNIPGTFTLEELALFAETRRLCGFAERPALMPPTDGRPSRWYAAPIVPIRTLREKVVSAQDTQEISQADLNLVLR